MPNQYFYPFTQKKTPEAVNVLTVAATFPSLIQPWLINHLVQIERFGGENRIISRNEEKDIFSDAIIENQLLEKYLCIPGSKLALFTFRIKAIINQHNRQRISRLLNSYTAHDAPLKTRVFDYLAAPALSITPDVIHSHSEPVGTKLINLIKANKAPLVITFHGLPPIGVPKVTKKAREEYTAAADLIFVNTQFAKNQYENLGAPSGKIRIIPQGIDLRNWPFSPRYYPDEGPINLLTVGRLHPDKGHRFAIEAVNMLIQKGFNLHYTIVGSGSEKQPILDLASEFDISDRVTVKSSISDDELRSIYRNSHIFILPSLKDKDGYHEETQGVVLQEAQASGLITIATKTGGIPEVIDVGNSGYLVPDRDAEALANKLLEIIDLKNDWPDIQKKAREWVETHFCANKIGERMNAYYREISNL